MRFAIITSVQDPASVNIMEYLLEHMPFSEEGVFENDPVFAWGNVRIYALQEKLIHAENLDRGIEADSFIFASKHASRDEVPALCCHVIGNWNLAEHGGKDRVLVKAEPSLLRRAYLGLKQQSAEIPSHQITLEATHHGPFIEKPAIFIEVGSSPLQWSDKKAAAIVGEAILSIIRDEASSAPPLQKAIGIGGPHYALNFNKVMERTGYAIGHICPKHMLPFLDEAMIRQAMEKSGASTVILDWKGMGKEKERIKDILQRMGIPYLRADKIL